MTSDGGCDVELLTQSIQLSTSLVARLCISGGDVYFSSVGNIAFRDHTANAFGTTGNENDLVLCSESAFNSVGSFRILKQLTVTSKRVERSILNIFPTSAAKIYTIKYSF